MKKILYEAELTTEQLNLIPALSESVGLCEQTVRILVGRGVDTTDKIKAFIHPSKERFLNPFLMSGMDETIALLKRARDEQWTVAVYGDYDADGICASTIMYRALCEFGLDAYVYVPERKNGYGLGVQSIDAVFEDCFPQLFITVDCGISNAAEVEYIKEQGAEVIVTDHHELPDVLPDCICVNPKIADDYPYDNLCGAGVAFKVACALLGKEAYKFLDFAAIATVADSVPITGENRDIVAEGLALINSKPRANYSQFFNKQGEKITAQTLAFTVAPKINAAGRMGDAAAALKLFLSDDESEIYDYSVKLTSYNMERQICCDELYLSAKQKIKEKGADGRVILFWDESWNAGFVGIVAARLAEEYSRPTLLFVKNGDALKGSARSIDGVNVFEALKSCSDLLTEFGGHSQAAGVNVEEDKLDELENALDEYFRAQYPQSAFTPSYYINGETSTPYSERFIRELELLEPFGVGNRKPQFVLYVEECRFRPLKSPSQHLSFKFGTQDFMYFSGKKHEKLLKSPISKKLIFDYAISVFRGKEQIRGYIRDVIYSPDEADKIGVFAAMNTVNLASLSEVNADIKHISKEQAQSALKNRKEYGYAFIAFEPSTLDKYDLCGVDVNLFTLSSSCLSTVLIVSPLVDCDLSDFERIIFLDNPKSVTLPSLEGKTVEICGGIDGLTSLNTLDTDRENLLSEFRYVCANRANLYGYDLEDLALNCPSVSSPVQSLFALKVFEQLNLVQFEEGRITPVKGVKTQLSNSPLYNFVVEYENGNR